MCGVPDPGEERQANVSPRGRAPRIAFPAPGLDKFGQATERARAAAVACRRITGATPYSAVTQGVSVICAVAEAESRRYRPSSAIGRSPLSF